MAFSSEKILYKSMISAGIDTSEWSWDNLYKTRQVKHKRAKTSNFNFSPILNRQFFCARNYFSEKMFNGKIKPTKMQLKYVYLTDKKNSVVLGVGKILLIR